MVPDYLAPLTDYLRAGVPVGHRPAGPTGDIEHTARCSTAYSPTSRSG